MIGGEDADGIIEPPAPPVWKDLFRHVDDVSDAEAELAGIASWKVKAGNDAANDGSRWLAGLLRSRGE